MSNPDPLIRNGPFKSPIAPAAVNSKLRVISAFASNRGVNEAKAAGIVKTGLAVCATTFKSNNS